jgi:hypothetical protein
MLLNPDSISLTKLSIRLFYFVALWFSSLLLADIGVITLVDIGTKVYLIDIIFFYFFFCFLAVGVKTKFRFYQLNRFFLFFLLILFASIFHGIFRYGFSAIGEGRYVYWLWMFAVPLYFYNKGELQTLRDFDKLFKLTFCLVVLNVLFLLVVEIINGGRFFLAPSNQEFARLEDTRGVRYYQKEKLVEVAPYAFPSWNYSLYQKQDGPFKSCIGPDRDIYP